MANNNFTDQVYKKVRDVVTNQKFESDWQSFLRDSVHVDKLLAADGPNSAEAAGLERLRSKIQKDGSCKPGAKLTAGKVVVSAAKSGQPEGKWIDRAATVKMLKHFYRYSKRGAQDVWIYSPPKAYTKWIFDEVQGNDAAVIASIEKEEEIYTESEKAVMCQALGIALACSQKTEKLLADCSKETRAVVTRWFADDATTAADTKADVATLLQGFKRITNVCNSTKLVFPDDPNDRKSATKYDKLYGSVWPGGEGLFPVIYLAGAFKKAGNSGKLWLCAQTIIHEASHLEVKTHDHQYDSAGLKPGASFPHAKAIANADSWGYFCVDLCGYLSKSDRETVLK